MYLTTEIVQTIIGLACLALAIYTLDDSVGAWRRLRGNPDRIVRAIASSTVRNRILVLGIVLIGLTMSVDRLWMLASGEPMPHRVRWLLYGAGRTAMQVLATLTTMMNLWALRKAKREA